MRAGSGRGSGVGRTGRLRRRATTVLAVCLAGGVLAGCGTVLPRGSDDTVTLDFFQFKPEAVETFDTLIAGFEARHPGIDVKQHQPTEPEATIRARMVKNNPPDVMTLNGNSTFGELAAAGVFRDFSGERDLIDAVNPEVQQVLDDLGTAGRGEHNGLPFASNATGVLYNKELFARHDVDVPRSWGELMAAVETFERAGVTPFYGTLQEGWTALPAFCELAGNLQPDDFFTRREAGRTSFTAAYQEVARKLATLYRHTQPGAEARNYNAGNEAFARGEAAMYLQGSFTLPAVKAFEPDFEIGVFALPALDEPGASELVSGVDVALTMPREAEHPEEALAFIRYLMRPEVVADYAEQQSAVPTLKGTRPSDPALRPLTRYFTEGRIIGFVDHQIPLAVRLENLVQEFLLSGDRQRFLRKLDAEYDKVQRRRGG